MTKTRLDRLHVRQDQLAAQIDDLAAREKLRKRKSDTRRKIVLGGFVARHMAMNPGSPLAEALTQILARAVTDPRDRRLLNLPPLAEVANARPVDQAGNGTKPSLKDGTPILKR